EVDVPQFRREWRASVSIGCVSFFAPFFAAGALAYWVLGWNLKQSEIAGIALSTTSLAVVYAVLVETGLNQELVGKRLMSATFVTDFGTAAALSRRAARLRPRPRARQPLRRASRGTGSPARGGVRLPHTSLLPQGRLERLA